MIESSQSYSIFFDTPPKLRDMIETLINYQAAPGSPPIFRKYVELNVMIWRGAYLWVLHHQRKQTREKDALFNDPYMVASEKFGSFLNCLLEICQKNLTIIDKLKIELENRNCALDWWKLLLHEVLEGQIHRRQTLAIFKPAANDKERLARVKEEVNALLAWENPFAPEETPSLFNFVETCRVISIHDPHDYKVIKQEKKELRDLWLKCWRIYRYLLADWEKHGEFITGTCAGYDVWLPQEGRQKPKLLTSDKFLKQKRGGRKKS